jgi:beta-glucosidase
VWFDEKGGFSRRGNIAAFERFVAKVGEEFGQDITFVLTMNEPNVYSSFGYMTGEWPPQEHNPIKGLWVYNNLAVAHRRAFSILKDMHPHLLIGPAVQFGNSLPKSPDKWLDKMGAKVSDYAWNWWWVNRIKHHMDFIGFNYYFTNYYQGFKQVNPSSPHNDLGWYMEPEGVGDVLIKAWMRYHKPLLITENGVADHEDKFRKWWIEETMHAMHNARKAGVNVIGYLHWSLLDNFEWKYGWWPKFGLIKVDRERDMKRLVRPSAVWWSKELEKLKHKD